MKSDKITRSSAAGVTRTRSMVFYLKISLYCFVFSLLTPILCSEYIISHASPELFGIAESMATVFPFVSKMVAMFGEQKSVVVASSLAIPLLLTSAIIFFGVAHLAVCNLPKDKLPATATRARDWLLLASIASVFILVLFSDTFADFNFVGIFSGKNIIFKDSPFPFFSAATNDHRLIKFAVTLYSAFVVIYYFGCFFILLHPVKFVLSLPSNRRN